MPGKYATEADAMVHDWTLDGGYDECGDVQFRGWHCYVPFDDECRRLLDGEGAPNIGRCVGAIVHEDGQGFVDVDYYEDQQAMDRAWVDILTADEEADDDESDDAPPAPWCDIHNAPHAPGNLTCELRSAEAWAAGVEGEDR